MSDSRTADTRRIFSMLLAAVLALSFSVTKASVEEAAPMTPAAPQPAVQPAPQPISQPPATEPTRLDSIGLFYALEGFDLAKLLGSIMQNEVLLVSGFNHDAFRTALFDLVQYMRNNIDSQSPSDVLASLPKYRRLEMFGTWVNENGPQDCYNTRTEVLLRDLDGAKVTFTSANPCIVYRGRWIDPYSGSEFKTASAMQVDHVVPLKNAYRSGAHAWTRERRCHYANYLDDSMHLLAVSGHENMSKGDSGPESYLPPNEAYICAYIANWMRIKASWNLQFSHDEALTIEQELRDRGCKAAEMRPLLSDIQKNRTDSVRMNAKCSLPQ